MQEIHLNASDWSTKEDFYTDLLPQLGAPAWHGHNLDALMDGISGDINTLEPPYTVYVSGVGRLSLEMRRFLASVELVFEDARTDRGTPVNITFDQALR